tara:strand:+ start:6286 stop:6477 length:192 start_codon:yes stop_codon:yes gene_type:complete
MIFLIRFLFIQSYHFVLNVVSIATKFVSKFAILDLQILAVIVILHLFYKIIKQQIFIIKKTIF